MYKPPDMDIDTDSAKDLPQGAVSERVKLLITARITLEANISANLYLY